MTRFRLYFVLLDIALAIQLFAILRKVLQAFDIKPFGDLGHHGWLSALQAIFALLIPTILIFMRWMRDDFSEALWQKTAGSVLKLLVILLMPAAFALAWHTGENDAAISAISAIGEADAADFQKPYVALIVQWVLVPFAFTFCFQWHRWRASW